MSFFKTSIFLVVLFVWAFVESISEWIAQQEMKSKATEAAKLAVKSLVGLVMLWGWQQLLRWKVFGLDL